MINRLKNLSTPESELVLQDFQLTLLKQISELSISPVDMDRLLNLMMELVLQMMQVESGSIILMDHNTGNLVFRVAHGPRAEEIKQFQLKPGQGIAGWVVETGQPLLVNDVTKDSRWYGDLSLKIDYRTNDILCVPLRIKEKTLGALELINRYEEYPFTVEDLEIATVLANNLAIVLENFNLFEITERKISELNSISEVTKNINSVLEIDPLLKIIMDLATDIMKAEASSVLLLNKETQELIFRLAIGDKGQQVEQIILKLDEGVAGWVAQHGEPLIINDVAQDPRFNPDVDKTTGFKTQAIIGAPLDQPDHARRAIYAALKIQEQMRAINARRQSNGQEVLDMGIGINTGEAIVGNIGSEKRMEYTAIGNVINTAFHLQEISRGGYQILITENTYRRLGNIPPDLAFKKHINEQMPYGLSPYYEVIPRAAH